MKQRVPLKAKVMAENDWIAGALRSQFQRHGTLCLNLISSPGAGKTTLLEKTLQIFPAHDRVAVLTGDIQTENDAVRLAKYGFPVKQIATGGACHLDADRVQRALSDWPLADIELLLIENVGNLICPSSYDLGEAAKVVLFSITEGEDKPLKYPATFHKAELVVVTKMDLLPHLVFDLELARRNVLRVQPQAQILEVSAITGSGVNSWGNWLSDKRRVTKERRQEAVGSAR